MMRFGLIALAALATCASVSVHGQTVRSSSSSSTGGGNSGGSGYPPYYPGTVYPQAADDASFCDRLVSANALDYTNPQHAYALMYVMVQRAYNGAIVNGSTVPPTLSAVQGLVNNRNTISYFDGTIDYRNTATSTSPYKGTPTPNIKQNKYEGAILDDKIARFLGVGFGCTGGPVGAPAFQSMYPYSPQSMTDVHSGMGITQLQFVAFIDQFSNAALSLGATSYDFQLNVVPFLQSFSRGATGSSGICNDATCSCATGFTGADCSSRDTTSTGVVVNPGGGPGNPDFGGSANAIGASPIVGFLLAALATWMAMKQ